MWLFTSTRLIICRILRGCKVNTMTLEDTVKVAGTVVIGGAVAYGMLKLGLGDYICDLFESKTIVDGGRELLVKPSTGTYIKYHLYTDGISALVAGTMAYLGIEAWFDAQKRKRQ